jgi:hypothetical protein
MSDTESTKVPPPHTLVATGNGVARYRPALTALYVDRLPDGDRLITVDDDGRLSRFRLSPAQAKHLAGLLHSEDARAGMDGLGEVRHG